MMELTCVTVNRYSDSIDIGLEFGASNVYILQLQRGQSYLSVIARLNTLEIEIRETVTETATLLK